MPQESVAAVERIEARCLACRYALRGLPRQSQCPECGRPFDLDDPWTVWLPSRPRLLVRSLMREPASIARTFPVAAAITAAWGASVPGWGNSMLYMSILLAVSGLVTIWLWSGALSLVERRGYSTQTDRSTRRRWRWRVSLGLIAVVILITLRPTMFAALWISRPWLDRHARWQLAQPFQVPAGTSTGLRGLYLVRGARRCPHGVKFFVTDHWNGYDRGPGFFYRSAPGECHRFEQGMPLGGGWYASP
jgi:hypothetical protein